MPKKQKPPTNEEWLAHYLPRYSKTSDQNWKDEQGIKYKDFLGRNCTVGSRSSDEDISRRNHAAIVNYAIQKGGNVSKKVINSVIKAGYGHYLKENTNKMATTVKKLAEELEKLTGKKIALTEFKKQETKKKKVLKEAANPETIIGYLQNADASTLVGVHNEYCRENGYDDDEIYDNDEEFFNVAFGNDVMKAVRAVSYGEYKYTDEYVKFNGYGNLESFSNPTDQIDLSAIAQDIAENPERYDSYIDVSDDFVEEDEFDNNELDELPPPGAEGPVEDEGYKKVPRR